jgi:hypothetical protein
MRSLLVLALLLAPIAAHAQSVFDVCKGESKKLVAGTGKLSIALVFAEDFPGRTTREVLFPIGERLAIAESARVILVAEVDDAIKLVGAKRWTDKGEACSASPTLKAVLGQKHSNLSTAHVSLKCDGAKCDMIIDLERHGRNSSERWVRYVAPVENAKDTKSIAKAAPKLQSKGPPPDAPNAGLATDKLATGKIRTRSDLDGALEADRVMEASDKFGERHGVPGDGETVCRQGPEGRCGFRVLAQGARGDAAAVPARCEADQGEDRDLLVKRAFVTGGSGFVGRALTRDAGLDEVRALSSVARR